MTTFREIMTKERKGGGAAIFQIAWFAGMLCYAYAGVPDNLSEAATIYHLSMSALIWIAGVITLWFLFLVVRMLGKLSHWADQR